MDDNLKSSPKSIDMIVMLADFYIQNNLIDQAIEVLNSSTGETKEFIKVYIKLIEAYLIKGDEDNAKNILKRVRKIDPENEEMKELENKFKPKIEIESTIQKDITIEVGEEDKEILEKEEITDEKGVVPLKSILKKMSDKNEELMGSLLIDETGILITEDLKIPIDIEGTAAMIAAVYADIEDVIKRIKLGLFEYMFFDFPKGKLLALCSKPVILVILGTKEIELGMLLLQGKETFEKIKKILGL